jgi:RNA polymerase sigma-70 factor (ECF subfamily)
MAATPDLQQLLTHSEWLRRVARRLVADAATADDLVQDTWMAALRQPPDPDRPAKPWLASVVRRLAALRSRREAVRARAPHGPQADRPGIEDAVDDSLARAEVERSLADHVLALEEPYRSAILLRYYRGMSAEEIARELGVPAATVRTRSMRGLERLRARLDRAHDGDGRSWMAALGPLCTGASAPIPIAHLLGATFMLKWIAGIALVGAVLLVAWPRAGASSALGVASPDVLPPAQLVHELPVAPSTAEPPAEAAARVAINPEAVVPPVATSEVTGLIVRAVRRDNAQPVPGVHGYLTPAGSGGGYRITWPEGERNARVLENAISDAAGILRFDLPHGQPLVLHLSAYMPNIGPLERPIAPLSSGESREVLAELPVGPDVHFVGRVVDDVTDDPLGALEVTIPDNFSSGGVVGRHAMTTTDADGVFALDCVSWGRHHVEIDAPGYGRVLAVLVAGHDSRETAQELRLQRAATLDVHVVGPGGVPSAVEVRATTGFSGLIRPRTGAGDTVGSDPRWSVTTTSDGRAQVTGLPPDVPIALELWRGDQLARHVAEAPQLAPGESRTLVLSLGTGARIVGEARGADAEPIAGLEVWLRAAERESRDRYFSHREADAAEQRIVSDTQGRFVFEDVPSGAWLVGPAAHAPPFEASHAPPLARFVRIAEGTNEERVTLEIAQALAIRGIVVDAAGIPRAGVWVRLDVDSLDGIQGFLTGEDGRFVAAPLAPGRFRLVAHGRDDAADSAPTWVLAGAEEEIRLTLAPAAQIHGRVVDDKTGEGRRAELRLISADQLGGYVRWNHSSREGDFRLEALEQGTYHLLARSDEGGIALLRDLVIDGSTSLEGVEVRLRRGAILVVSDPQATADRGFSLVHDDMHAGHGYVSGANVSEQVVQPGRTTLIFDGGPGTLEVELPAGERREITLPASTRGGR